ncbi:TetR family transcriptional regulator [Heliobacterium gestii]|uniref:TetR family transcriptional regulator n=1 Tax=Heliomicrobium gestii TaxID=2699 RepID=A0A845LEM4_HELGE|nr:TetR/AcrR family transcriptional regulator [Heliomicrobium gestii]MBM7866316.1 AcrR family transcriptional regulator [Heliomicrobium gestii]MZP42895.1 TetR family transcriptional regulator [Heliomicrobium gestii]
MTRITKKPEERKSELIDAAYHLFLEKGYHHTTVSDIVKEVSVAQGTFFYHFPTKEAILEAIMERYISQILDDAKQIVENATFTAPQKFCAFVDSIFVNLIRQGVSIPQLLCEDKHRNLKHKIETHCRHLFTPYVIQILEQGTAERSMAIEHLPQTVDYMNTITSFLIESSSFGESSEDVAKKAAIAEKLLACALGVPREQIVFHSIHLLSAPR